MSEIALRDLTKQLPHNPLSLKGYFALLGGSAMREFNTAGVVVYKFRDSNGELITTSLATAWRWVCTQYGITAEKTK